jgi:hypothetical protein
LYKVFPTLLTAASPSCRQANVDAAAAVGLTALRFGGCEELEAALRERGLAF